MITHIIESYCIPKEDKVKVTNLKNLAKFQFFKFWNKHYTRHTLWSCLIRCANMKWIRQVLLKMQSGHHSVHRRTDRRTDRWTDRWTRWNQYTPPFNFVEAGGIIIPAMTTTKHTLFIWALPQQTSSFLPSQVGSHASSDYGVLQGHLLCQMPGAIHDPATLFCLKIHFSIRPTCVSNLR